MGQDVSLTDKAVEFNLLEAYSIPGDIRQQLYVDEFQLPLVKSFISLYVGDYFMIPEVTS
jgi:hypothetical protein